jgi:hypothetical protein
MIQYGTQLLKVEHEKSRKFRKAHLKEYKMYHGMGPAGPVPSRNKVNWVG